MVNEDILEDEAGQDIAIPEWDLTITTGSEDDELLPEEQTLMARIPYLAGNNKKVGYLAYRSCGFTVGQSCELAGCTRVSVQNWRKNDPVFKHFEDYELQTLQKTVGPDVIKFEMMRNMRMLLKSDMMLIAKGMTSVEDMSSREYELFKNLRKFYTPTELLQIDKLVSPGKHIESVTFNLTWGTRVEVPQIEGSSQEIEDGDFTESDDD